MPLTRVTRLLDTWSLIFAPAYIGNMHAWLRLGIGKLDIGYVKMSICCTLTWMAWPGTWHGHDWELGIRPVARAAVCIITAWVVAKTASYSGRSCNHPSRHIRSGDAQRHKQCSCMHSTWALEGVAVEWDPYCRKHWNSQSWRYIGPGRLKAYHILGGAITC